MEFKNMFPKGKINVGQALLFRKSPDGTMTVQLDVSNSLKRVRKTIFIPHGALVFTKFFF